MSNSIFHYDYKPFGGYKPTSVNLGDYVQSIAAAQFFEKIDRTIGRDSLSTVDRPTNIIGNGWYWLDPTRHTPTEHLNILPVSIHINNQNEASLGVIKKISKGRVVGCRDLATLKFLQSNNIEAYFSSCLTTTLKREDVTNKTERNGIVLCDLDLSISTLKLFPLTRFCKNYSVYASEAKFVKRATSYFKYYDGEEIKYTFHECSLDITQEDRFIKAKKLLETYANARCVFTSRIHCALPCLALGTPVVLITRRNDFLRYQGLQEYLNHIWIEDNGHITQNVETFNGEVINSDLFKGKAEELKKACIEFAKYL